MITNYFQKKSNKSIVNIYNISKKVLLFSDSIFSHNPYGVVSSILEYIGEEKDKAFLTCPVEHGLDIYCKYVIAYENINCSDYIITNSIYNEDKIKQVSNKKVIKIGPYIEYAKGVYSESILNEIKKKNGRTLLVFPTHGIKGFEPRFEVELLIKEIERIKKYFKTVIVCMYYHDILRGYHKPYIKKGYDVVSAGNAACSFFLSKLKSIIELSDAIISNEYTTGLLYSIYLDKPVYIYNLPLKWDNTEFNNADKFDDDLFCYDNIKYFFELCNDPMFGKLKEQREWGKCMIGTDLVRGKDDLRDLLSPVIRKI